MICLIIGRLGLSPLALWLHRIRLSKPLLSPLPISTKLFFVSQQKEVQEIVKRGKGIEAQIKNLIKAENKVKTARRKVEEAEEDVNNYDGEAQKKDIVKKLMNGIKAQVTCLETAGSHYDEVMTSTYRLCGVKMNDSGVMEKARLLK